MSVSIETRRAWSEIDSLIELLDEATKSRIPIKLREFFKTEKDQTYQKIIDGNIPIKEQNLKPETLALVAMLNLEYICQDEAEKNRLKDIYESNEIAYKNAMKEKYSLSFLNKEAQTKPQNENVQNDSIQVVEYEKESFFAKLIMKIKSIFHR